MCTSTSTVEAVDQQLTISPNPANDVLSIATSSLPEQVVVRDGLGRVVLIAGSVTEVDISSLTSGVYFLTVVNEGTHVVRQFVKD